MITVHTCVFDAQGRSGLSAYLAHAKELLAESAADKNPFEGYAVEVPDCVDT